MSCERHALNLILVSGLFVVKLRCQHRFTHLDEEEQVRILTLRGGTVTLLDVVLLNVDTLVYEGIKESTFHPHFVSTRARDSASRCRPTL